jgi:hypothetical protein
MSDKHSKGIQMISCQRLIDEIDELFDQMKNILVEYREYVELYEKYYLTKKKKINVSDKEKYKKKYINLKQSIRIKLDKLEESDKAEKSKYKKKINKYDEKLEGYITEYRSLTLRIKEINLQNENKLIEKPNKNQKLEMNNDKILEKSEKINKNTTEVLINIKKNIGEMTEIGNTACEILEKDKEILTNISNNVDNIDSELVIAKKRIIIMFKRVYTDKILISFILLICIIIVTIVVLKNIKKI